MFRKTHAVIDLNILRSNINNLRQKVGNVNILPMVKSDAYGHGIIKVSQCLVNMGIGQLGVAIPEEALLLRENGIQQSILCVGALQPDCEKEIISQDITQTIFDLRSALRLNAEAARQNKLAKVHIKIDTGMNRLGVRVEHLPKLLEQLCQCKAVKVQGVMTYLALADEQDRSFTLHQNELFQKAIEILNLYGYKDIIKHCANSAAILDYDQMLYDMVRPGIMIYGYYPSKYVSHCVQVKPILSWYSSVVHIFSVDTGESVSYGHTFTADRPTDIAVVALGYGDGYSRLVSNIGHVVINGRKAPIIGKICMDQMMVDITGVKDVDIDTKVTLIGEQGDEVITADDIAGWVGTISYEVMLSITNRVPKSYIGENNE